MKLLLFVLLVGFLMTVSINYSFGDITGQSSFYYKQDAVNVLKMNEEYLYQITLRGEGSFAYEGKARFFIGDVSDKSPEPQSFFDFNVGSGSFENFGFDYTPHQTGRLLLTMIIDEDGSGGLSELQEEMTQTFYVVDEYSKAYGDNHGCQKDEHLPVVKPTFSSVVCVSEDTKNVLVERGWHFG